MGYVSLQRCVADLEQHGHLVRLGDQVDARLEVAEIQRRVYMSGGPAVFFENVRDCQFPMVSNLFGTKERMDYIFRDTLAAVRSLVDAKIDPATFLRRPSAMFSGAKAAFSMLPRRCSSGPVLANQTTVDKLPQLVSWPDDGGPFVTLPIVYTEDVLSGGLKHSNLGMYRVQLGGGQYRPGEEIGLHYQIHRGIAIHHASAIAAGKPLRVNIFVGGSPAMTVAAVMPLPEGMSELGFAGALAGHRIPMICSGDNLPIYAQADFCISGTLDGNRILPEGPFGDHLGYYSLEHDFPVLRVDKVYHRADAIWPFTVVGRPPQEDTMFGELIHEITGPIVPTVVPGVHAVHAVDAAGVHPLMLAIGSERYVPYEKRDRPQELLTQANAILGQGQMSLAKYLMIVNREDAPDLHIEDVRAFFEHLLERVDWERDLHFQTRTTIDTLDYSGSGLNDGSKVVIAAVGPARRELVAELPADLRLPDHFDEPRVCLPGVLAIRGPKFGTSADLAAQAIEQFCQTYTPNDPINRFPLVLIVDDSQSTSESLRNFLWVVFTRSNPAADIYGIGSHTVQRHWGARGSLVIDVRIKPHHAPPLVEDPQITARVDAMAARGGPLARYL